MNHPCTNKRNWNKTCQPSQAVLEDLHFNISVHWYELGLVKILIPCFFRCIDRMFWIKQCEISSSSHLLLTCCICDTGDSGNWIEIAYGTSSGAVRVIVQHPETVGSGPQLFQTFSVHRSPVTKMMLSEKHLISGTAVLMHTHTHTFFCFPFK